MTLSEWLSRLSLKSIWVSICQRSACFLRHLVFWVPTSWRLPREIDTEKSAQYEPESSAENWTTAADGTKILRKNIPQNVRNAQGEFIAFGLTGIVELLKDGRVLKSPFPSNNEKEFQLTKEDIEFEAQVFEEIGPHPRIVTFFEYEPTRGILLEHMKHGSLKTYMKNCDENQIDIPLNLRCRWIAQAADGLQFLHDKGIIYCDMKPNNCLINEDLELKLCDFSGSCHEGGRSNATESARYRLPRPFLDGSSRITDVFALGSTIYEIVSGKPPYDDVASDKVVQLFELKDFPDTKDMYCGDLIRQCWLGEVAAGQIRDAAQALQNISASEKT